MPDLDEPVSGARRSRLGRSVVSAFEYVQSLERGWKAVVLGLALVCLVAVL